MESIAEMPDKGAYCAANIHQLVKELAPQLKPKLWYGMPAYANELGKVVLFFQEKNKYQTRYSSLSFEDSANLDEGVLWLTTFAIVDWNDDIEAQVRNLIQKAVR